MTQVASSSKWRVTPLFDPGARLGSCSPDLSLIGVGREPETDSSPKLSQATLHSDDIEGGVAALNHDGLLGTRKITTPKTLSRLRLSYPYPGP